MKILLTGSSGFIGSFFVNNYRDKYDIQTFSFLNEDINMLDCKGVDIVLHLSALVHQMKRASKEVYEKVNVDNTIKLAQKAKTEGVKHFIFMSTVKVYGEETNSVYTENTSCNPCDDYGKSKLKAEQLLLKLGDNNFKVSIIRTPIVYGKGVKANIKALVSLVNKVSILPFSGIYNRRSMVYIGNLCHLVDTVIQQEKKGIFLASDDKALSTTELINLIALKLNKDIKLIKLPFFDVVLKFVKPAFYKRLYCSLEVNNERTKEILNLKNPYTVEEGIDAMMKGENN